MATSCNTASHGTSCVMKSHFNKSQNALRTPPTSRTRRHKNAIQVVLPYTKYTEIIYDSTRAPPLKDTREPHPSSYSTMAEHLGRRPSRGSQDSLFRGKGKAVLTILGYKNWKSFLKVEDRDLTVEEMVDIEYSADYDNFAVEGQIRVNWPDITVEFNMDRFTGIKTCNVTGEVPFHLCSFRIE